MLTKLTADDNVETYTTHFEWTVMRERWPRTDWANYLMPFLTGEAQKTCQDHLAIEAANYDQVKTTILAQYGLNLPT